MKNRLSGFLTLLVLILSVVMLSGCAGSALGTKIKYRNAVTNLEQGKEIFIPKLKGNKVAIRISDTTGLGIDQDIKNRVSNVLTQRGYQVLPSTSSEVDYIVRVKLVSKDSRTAASDLDKTSPVDGAIPGAIGGAIVGAATGGDVMTTVIGAGIGAVAGSTISQISDNLVQVHTLAFRGELQVDEVLDHNVIMKTTTDSNAGKHTRVESTDIEETNIKSYRGDFVVTTQQEGLKWDEVKDGILERIALGVAGPFEAI